MPLGQIDWGQFIPFVLATGQSQRLSVARIIEGIIIGGVAAAGSMYVTVQVLQTEMRDIRSDVQKVEQQVEDFRKDFYRPVYEDARTRK